MTIRFAEPEDIEQIVQLCEQHALYEKADYNKENKAEELSNHLFGTIKPLKCLVVEIDKELVGYASFMKQFSTWDASYYIYLDCLFLKEKVRGMKLGTKLMEKVKEYARQETCEMIQWQTPHFNTRAIKFYRTLGAVSKTKERFFWEV